MNLQNLDLQLLEYNILNTFPLEIFLGWSTLLLLVWFLAFQNVGVLGYLSLATNVLWITFVTVLLSLFVCYNISFVHYHWIPSPGLVFDTFGHNARMITLTTTCTLLLIILSYTKENSTSTNELCSLVLLSVLSLIVLTSVNDFLCLFMCIELQSLSFYVLACSRKKSDFSIEAGVKYFITGAIASCVMLFGISIIYGISGTLNFAELKEVILSIPAESLTTASLDSSSALISLNLALFFLIAALFFKLGIAPLHFWLPDVYEGSPTNITAYFALVPKVALLVMVSRLLLDVFDPFLIVWQPIVILLSIISVVVGCFGAIYQRRIKRLLAYSTVGHNGFLILAIAAANQESLVVLMTYISVYIITSLSIFAFVLSASERGLSRENPTLYQATGIIKTNPILSLCLVLPLFSLAGIPPFVGFVAKYQVLLVAVESGFVLTSALLIIVSVIASYYYIRFTKVHFFEGTLCIWNKTVPREVSICLALSSTLVFLLTILPKSFNVFIF